MNPEGRGEPEDPHDETVVVSRRASAARHGDGAPSVDAPGGAPLSDETVIAERRPSARKRSVRGASEPAADPEPWRAVPAPVYGPRSATQRGDAPGPDAVHRRIGPAPSATAQPVVERPPLPSLAKRARRSRTITIIAYAATTALSVVGLWLVAALAFG
ncbi:hypothetical protein [Leucobacter tenebrionis]|uniref:hypothetical protein n=1 Tax=Leucobacter tenebrionis TaxID=2873270 RepID=UPI001CA6CC3C|nr:hypothetical protein [Leucobacter tenebrionis]QZY51126.1 hypothetical protein KVY00_10990 [Leucobacter tenebrionis]